MKTVYDSRTEITFLMIGLGVGALLSLFLHPAREDKLSARRDLSQTTGLGRMSA